MSDLARAFVERSRYHLVSEFLPKIRRCLDVLPEEDLWWRPNDVSNSVGNLLLHLAGNVRQWIVTGIGEAPDVRDRVGEFSAREGATKADLLADLEAALESVDDVLAGLDTDRLSERTVIQGHDVSLLEALYHAVEHFSMHVGQIIYVVKLRTGTDLEFYRVEEGTPRHNW